MIAQIEIAIAAQMRREVTASRHSFTPRGSTQFPGLLDAAKALGVHRNHLYLVLSGRRVSHSLTQRYADLKGGLAS